MIKQIKKTKNNDVHLHTMNFLKEHLPNNYVQEVQEKTGYKFSNASIHSVKSGKRTNETILLALVEVAKKNKETKEKIKQIINN